MKKLNEGYLDRKLLLREIVQCRECENQLADRKRAAEGLRTKLKDYEKAVRELYLDKARGILSEREYLTISAGIADERKAAEKQLADAEKFLLDMTEQAGRTPEETLEQYLHPERLTREMTESLIDHVEVFQRIPGSRDVEVTIHWKF